MATYFITGASRGIGLELTRQLLQLPLSEVSKVFAATRSELSGELQTIISNNSERATHIVAAVDDTASVQRAAEEVNEKLGGRGLDVLVNNAGAISSHPGGPQTVPPEDLAEVFNVNVLGVQRVTAAFLPLLEKGTQKKVINM